MPATSRSSPSPPTSPGADGFSKKGATRLPFFPHESLPRQGSPGASTSLRDRSPSAIHQRELVEAIKRARNIALLPFATD
ncbi:hypothetical protein [Geothrix sp. 21YS21S-4]|uniref:hypothetical protein n=1 Tax=Geothrix sp. 21YS21S-4 TaxID=3068889 RepID=UPI0035936D08